MQPFTHFVGIDWTGAKGLRHPGLKVAICSVDMAAPTLVFPPSGEKSWSRLACSDWIGRGMDLPAGCRALVGVDAAFGYPFDPDTGYLQGDTASQTAPDLWQEIAGRCAEAPDLFGGPFIEHYSRHYRYQRYNAERRAFDTLVDNAYFEPRLRDTERLCIEKKYGPCESVFNLIGASQVGKSALSSMRMLDRLKTNENIAIWPFETAEDKPVVLVEIYAALFSTLGGGKGKVRNLDDLNHTLSGLGSFGYHHELPSDNTVDDVTDAIMTAAGMRKIASERKYWHPPGLSTMVRQIEGWIFGVV